MAASLRGPTAVRARPCPHLPAAALLPQEGGEQAKSGAGGAQARAKGGLAAVLESLGDVAQSEEQYAQEFSLDAFRSKLDKGGQGQ